MDAETVRSVVAAYADTRMIEANGDVFAIYDPDNDYERRPRQGWATIVNSDVNDSESGLDRPGVFRLNIGLPKPRYEELFHTGPDADADAADADADAVASANADADADAGYDPTAVDVVMPHPVYAGYHWACVLNPDATWSEVRGLLDDAHAFAVRKHQNAARRREGRA